MWGERAPVALMCEPTEPAGETGVWVKTKREESQAEPAQKAN